MAIACVAYLGVGSDGHLALLAGVGEEVLVALDAERVVVTQDVPVAGQRQVAVPAREVPRVEVLIHRLGVLPRKDQLQRRQQPGVFILVI